MLIAGSAFKGYAIEGTDGPLGTVRTFLFDDTTWKIRWLVVDASTWLTDRQVLIHPSAIGRPDHARQHLPVNLTKAQIKASPTIEQDQPVTMQRQRSLYSYYGWDPYWGPDHYGAGLGGFGMTGYGVSSIGMPGGYGAPYFGGDTEMAADTMQRGSDDGDPHLRSMNAVRGYHIHATDGSIGHVENFLLDDVAWTISYLVVDTRNWWPGAHVLISPHAVASIGWDDHQIVLNVSRDQVKTSPPWDPAQIVEADYERRLHAHYSWPGYGW
jgi:hypothetical protein